ncbi:MAG: nucleotide exchange factor GrpE [Nanoarchaeota archaeon]|nr:nucleotide exchange factor GrpE [Nanoarchaeota archaeon]
MTEKKHGKAHKKPKHEHTHKPKDPIEAPKGKDMVKDEKIQELTSLLQHLQADFENFRRRTGIEKQEYTKFASKELILDILPIIDNFELALKHTSNNQEFIQGIELVYAQFLEILEKKGLKSITALNQKFNPEQHEALMQEESKKPSGTITEEFQKGFSLNGKIIRPSKVKVAK